MFGNSDFMIIVIIMIIIIIIIGIIIIFNMSGIIKNYFEGKRYFGNKSNGGDEGKKAKDSSLVVRSD